MKSVRGAFAELGSLLAVVLMMGLMALAMPVRADDTATMDGTPSGGYNSGTDEVTTNFAGCYMYGDINPVTSVDLKQVVTLYSYISGGTPHFPGGSSGVVLYNSLLEEMGDNELPVTSDWGYVPDDATIPDVLSGLQSTYGSGVTGFHLQIDYYAHFDDGTQISVYVQNVAFNDSY